MELFTQIMELPPHVVQLCGVASILTPVVLLALPQFRPGKVAAISLILAVASILLGAAGFTYMMASLSINGLGGNVFVGLKEVIELKESANFFLYGLGVASTSIGFPVLLFSFVVGVVIEQFIKYSRRSRATAY